MTACDRFQKLLKRDLHPVLRAEGFKGSGSTLRRIVGDRIDLVNLQGSMGEKGMGEKGMGMGEKGMGENGMAKGNEPGMGKNMGKAQQGMNETKSEGDKDGGDKIKNAASNGKNTEGDGAFINLRKRERDKVQQNAEAQFPAEFRELIKQYNINIKNNKPAPAGK